MNYINLNGKIRSADEAVLLAANRGYRYGDGLFETMKMTNSIILLGPYHFERLFSGLSLLHLKIPAMFTAEKLREEILLLCRKNNVENQARIRLSVFRGNGGLYDADKELQYLIENWPLPVPANGLNENGLVIDVYPEARKSCDIFSNLKSANFLPYSMAALYAQENKLNDCLLLNTQDRISDSTIANVFIIKEGHIITPALDEGCVAGVMRRYLLKMLKAKGVKYRVEEASLSIESLLRADEIFLTNTIHGIRWVGHFRDKSYGNSETAKIYNKFIRTIRG